MRSVSSVNNINLKKFDVRQRSLMYVKTRSGPRMAVDQYIIHVTRIRLPLSFALIIK